MKKKIISFITIILSVLFTGSALTGCNLVTTDSERDMAQVVATISIEDGFYDEIYKKDLVMAYMNYGESYSEQGLDASQTIEQLITELVNSKVLVQNAMVSFNKGEAPFTGLIVDSSKGKADVTRYLTEEDIVDATYSTRTTMNSILEGLEEKDDDKSDTLKETVRTVPTGATNAEKELDTAQKKDFNAKKFENEYSRKAFVSVIKLLDNNNLKGEEYDGTIESTVYYKQMLKANYENKLLEKFSDVVFADKVSVFDFSDVEKAYEKKFTEQTEWTNAEFVSAFKSATESVPILYSNYNGYGYVYNLLIGANDDQTTKISEIDAKLSDSEKAAKRKDILATTTAKDLRSTWILSGYDFDGVNFTGDYSLVKDKANALPFKGTVKLLNESEKENEDFKAQYKIESTTTFDLVAGSPNNFIDMMDEYVYGDKKSQVVFEDNIDDNILRKATATNVEVSEYDGKINELIFAFSTDSGSLNKYKGYAITPKVDGADKEEYVETFANAGRELLNMGGTSYIIVASDYGYHIMFFSQLFTAGDRANENLVDYLNSLGETKTAEGWKEEFKTMLNGWSDYEDTTSYLYVLTNEVIANKITNEITSLKNDIVNKYWWKEEGKVVINKEVYSDMIAE